MRNFVILTQGRSDPNTAKTAASVVRYCRDEVVALLDDTQVGKTSQALLGVGGDLPVVGSLADAPQAKTLLIGIAVHGGKIPTAWRTVILEAIQRGLNVVSGLHEFLSDDPEFAAAAREQGVELIDVRKNNERRDVTREGIHSKCLRIHTVGHDANVGKMVTSIEVARGLTQAGYDAKFVATGQTGIMIEGDGCPVDAVVSDFVSGATERLIVENKDRDILVFEGQGSIAHPRFSAVTLGLLHGCVPDGLIVCCELGRTHYRGLSDVPLPSLAEIINANETMANLLHPCRVLGVAVNASKVTEAAAEAAKAQLAEELKLPVCDVFREGPGVLIDAVLRLRDSVRSAAAPS